VTDNCTDAGGTAGTDMGGTDMGGTDMGGTDMGGTDMDRAACTDVGGAPGGAAAADPAGLAERLRLTFVRLGRQLRRDDPPGLTITLYSALSTVVDHGELAIGELAEAEGVPASAATRIADRLEEAGLLTRRANPRDRRGVNVASTAEGRRLVADRRQRGNAWLAARLAGLTQEQRQTLADALGVLEAAASPDGPSCAAADTVPTASGATR
jgi:DNA-binding MarR family transcriptional regulator